MDEVEAVAKALCKHFGGDPDKQSFGNGWDEHDTRRNWEYHTEAARAAIAAYRRANSLAEVSSKDLDPEIAGFVNESWDAIAGHALVASTELVGTIGSFAAGREAGLREAAAVARQRREKVARNGWTVGPYDLEAVETDILALIDAGSPPPLRNASHEEAAGWPSLKQIIDAGSQKPPGSD